MEQAAQEQTETYQIAGATYRLEPLSWQQNKWLADHVFKDIDLQRLDYATIWDLFREKGPLIMAISLIKEGSTRADHSRRSFESISLQAELFACEMTGGEVAQFAPRFFQCCRPDQLAMFMPGKALQKEMEEAAKRAAEEKAKAEAAPSPAPGGNGSSAALSPSAVETSPKSELSSSTGGPTTASPISVDVLNGSTSTGPSSDSVG